MKTLTFFRACLLVPYVLAGLAYLSRPLLSGAPTPWSTISLYLLLAVVAGGIPYGILALLLWIWMPGKSTRAIRSVFAAAPLVLLAIVLASASLRFAWREALLVSYSYVALFLLAEQVVRRLGFMRDDATVRVRLQAS